MRRDDVLELLVQHPTGLSDAELGAQLGVLDTAVNGFCRALAQEGVIIRDRTRTPLVNIVAQDYQPPSRIAAARREWYTEAGVRSATVRHLSFAGASFSSTSDQIAATLAGRQLHAVPTGYPDMPIPGEPTPRARTLFADAILTGVLLRGRYPQDRIVLAFPAVSRYVDLRAGSAPMLDRIGVETWLVTDDGTVAAG